MKKIFFITAFLFFSFTSFVTAAEVDTVLVFSTSMQKKIKCVVIKPALHAKKKLRFPAVYLLHGYAGWYANWILRVPELKDYADAFGMLIVCPDGAASWYFDSPVDRNIKYETFISKEVPRYIDSAYRTIADRDHRAITGLSMGGHGALLIAWKHSEIFAAAGSMSGVLDMNEVKSKYGITKLLGDTVNFAANWKNYSVLNIVETKSTDSLALIIDNGIDDIFIAGNRRLHQKLLSLKFPHEYIERPGKHNWEYWKYSVHFQLLYFKKFFDKKKLQS